MAKQRTQTGNYSEQTFGDDRKDNIGDGEWGGGKQDKIRTVDIGPAEGIGISNPYGVKSFADAIDTDGMKDDGQNGGFSGPVSRSKGRSQGGVQPEVNTDSMGEQKQFLPKRSTGKRFNWS